MQLRPAVEADLGRLLACRVSDPLSWASEEKFLQNLASRSYRFEWTWIAEAGQTIVARAVWWGYPDGEHPLELDCLYVAPTVTDPIAVCSQLVTCVVDSIPAETHQPTSQLLLAKDWRSNNVLGTAVAWRLEAVARAGLTETVERLRFEWTSEAPVPNLCSRLTFTEEPDDEVWVDLFRRVAVGSLDSATRRAVTHHGADLAARNTLAGYEMLPGRRGWWRLAFTKNGELIGFAIPTRNEGGPVVGYLGVVPEHRGRGYALDLLAETTRVLADQGAQRIVADVDANNAPMVAAFERAHYRNFAVRIVASQPMS